MDQVGPQKSDSALPAHDSVSMPMERELDVFRRIRTWSETSNSATRICPKRGLSKAKKMLRLQSSKPVKDCSTSTIPDVCSELIHEGSTTESEGFTTGTDDCLSFSGDSSDEDQDPMAVPPISGSYCCMYCKRGRMSRKMALLHGPRSKSGRVCSTSPIPEAHSTTIPEDSTTASAWRGHALLVYTDVRWWCCGHCGFSPMSEELDCYCLNCHRLKDQYSSSFQ